MPCSVVNQFKRYLSNYCQKACTVQNVKNRLPITKWIPYYRFEHLQGDFIAGLTVGLTVIPQGLALAKVAGLPPQYGLYTAFMGCFVYTLLGTAKDVTVGPTAVMSLLVAQFGRSPKPGDPTFALILALFGGIIQILLGVFHIGSVVDYISHPVINSFTTAAAITIAEGQVKSWLGLKDIPREFIYELYWTLRKIPETRIWTMTGCTKNIQIPDFVLGLVCIIVLFILKKLKDLRSPCCSETTTRLNRGLRYGVWLFCTARNAVVVMLAATTVVIFTQKTGTSPFSTTGNITAGLPPFRPPPFSLTYNNVTYGPLDIFSHIGAGFAVIPVLGLVETMAVGKAFARANRYTIDANQELIAMGVANVLSSFVSGYPVTGSFSRTAVNSQSGVRTPAGGIVTGFLVLLSLQFLTPYFHFIPDAALAAVIIMAVLDLVSFSLVIKLWKVKKIDVLPWVVTFTFSLIINVEWGMITGVALSIILLLYPIGRPRVSVAPASSSLQMSYGEDVLVVQPNSGLVFPAIEYFTQDILKNLSNRSVARHVVIDGCHITSVDYTTVEGLSKLLEELHIRGVIIVFCNLNVCFIYSTFFIYFTNLERLGITAPLQNFDHLHTDVREVLISAELSPFLYADTVTEAVRLTYSAEDPPTDDVTAGLLTNDELGRGVDVYSSGGEEDISRVGGHSGSLF